MSIQKVDVVHLIGGLSSAASSLSQVVDSGDSTRALLAAIKKLATAIANSPASDTHISAVQAEKCS